MKNIALIIVFLFSFLSFANAQSNKQIAVNIPFDFYIQNQKLSAGEYLIESLSRESNQSLSTLVIRDKSGKAKGVIKTDLLELHINKKSITPALIFNCYGKEYFLAVISNPAEERGFAFRTTKTEKSIAKQFGKPIQETVAFNLAQ